MLYECIVFAFLLEVFQARPAGRRPRGGPRTHWRDYRCHLVWERLWISQEELENTARWRRGTPGLLFSAGCHCDPTPDNLEKMDGWMYFSFKVSSVQIRQQLEIRRGKKRRTIHI